MREIDPKTLKKAAPRPPAPKPVEEVVAVIDFPGTMCITGKVGECNPGHFSVFPETLDAGATTSTYSHPKKTKVFSVIQGELTVHSGEDVVLLKVGQSFEVPAELPYKLEAKNGPCVFFNMQDPSYAHRLKVDNTTEQAGTPADVALYSPAPRYRSKALAQLQALSPDAPIFREGPIRSTEAGINDMPVRFDDGNFI